MKKENSIFGKLWKCYTFYNNDKMDEGIYVSRFLPDILQDNRDASIDDGPKVLKTPTHYYLGAFSQHIAHFVIFGLSDNKTRAISISEKEFQIQEEKLYATCVKNAENESFKDFMKNKICVFRFDKKKEKFTKCQAITESGFYLVKEV